MLQIQNPRERAVVAGADRLLSAAIVAVRPFQRKHPPADARRILLLRLERIGDLVMALPAIAEVRALAPSAEIDLVVGSWNRELAEAIPAATRIETLDAAWLARADGGLGMAGLLRAALAWRSRSYDLAINLEPDIRSNLILRASGARWTAGYRSGGGGPLLHQTIDYEPGEHTSRNALRLVAAVFGRRAASTGASMLRLPQDAVARARARIRSDLRRPLIGLHASGGREIKQWDPDRFGEVARRLARECGASIVLTGTAADRPLVDRVKSAIPPGQAIDLAGDLDLLGLAAVLQELDLLVTGDTGPMHLASAVGTPVLAIFGPSDPIRYAPQGPRDRVVRTDLPCSPCNRIRQPPARCVGHTPDCLAFVSVEQVFEAAVGVLGAPSAQAVTSPGHATA